MSDAAAKGIAILAGLMTVFVEVVYVCSIVGLA
jgi:hypothetical protein